MDTDDTEVNLVQESRNRGLLNYKCDQCSKTFKTQSLVDKHKTDVHNALIQNVNQYNCLGCDYQSVNVLEQLKHTRITGHNPDIVTETCRSCRNSFSGIESLMNHRKLAHPSNKKCNYFPRSKITGEVCLWKDNCCYKHEKNEVLTDDINTCNFCDHISPIRAEMMFHVKKVHPEHARQCTTDNCPWSDQTCWYKHVKKDHGVVAQNEYKCSVCDSTFKRNQDVMLHKKRSTMIW